MNIGDAQSGEGKIVFDREFTRESGDVRTDGIIVDGWSAGSGRVREPGPASLSKASAPLADGFPRAGEFLRDFSISGSRSCEENNTRTEHIPLWAGCFAYDRFKIETILSGQGDCDGVRSGRHDIHSPQRTPI
ncbi:hypothetical protein C451_14110 [Halococcus thailandensis JCM 13552]|uniref:Uncharacterized protein n=1 Tax=Halococcus thailandensis JCM 13552 TaxID=1227457 RepID=M0N3Y1_9EURY|nr:hypothetical protein C451_14110 [Halococcus thailandensis JCM 13552]